MNNQARAILAGVALFAVGGAAQWPFPPPDPDLHKGLKPIYSDGDVPCSSSHSNHRTLRVALPEGAVLRHTYFRMANYPWVGGDVPCRSEQKTSAVWSDCPPDKDCGIGWSKVRNRTVNSESGRTVVTADFYNHKHDNHRRARLLVYYSE